LTVQLQPAFTRSLGELATLFNTAFDQYIGGQVSFTEASLASFIAHENVDLSLSQIVTRDDQPIGFGLIARQGWSSRLVAMGIVPRGEGVGKWALSRLIEQAAQRGDHWLELEVIEQNTPAVRLYEGAGFQRLRRLVGCEASAPPGEVAALERIDVAEIGRLVIISGAPDLPWQVAGASISRYASPNVGLHMDHAYAVISNPEAATIVLRTLFVPPDYRGQGRVRRLLRALFAQYPGKRWFVPAICPEEYGQLLIDHFGFQPQPISQFQMYRDLSPGS
jgi:GNAT superfamily N-acetyltransferase